MISLLISLLVFLVVCYVVYLIMGMIPLDPQIKNIAYIVVGLIMILVLISYLGYGPGWVR
jgi:heme A synthase